MYACKCIVNLRALLGKEPAVRNNFAFEGIPRGTDQSEGGRVQGQDEVREAGWGSVDHAEELLSNIFAQGQRDNFTAQSLLAWHASSPGSVTSTT